jgi:hypothetical protein
MCSPFKVRCQIVLRPEEPSTFLSNILLKFIRVVKLPLLIQLIQLN